MINIIRYNKNIYSCICSDDGFVRIILGGVIVPYNDFRCAFTFLRYTSMSRVFTTSIIRDDFNCDVGVNELEEVFEFSENVG